VLPPSSLGISFHFDCAALEAGVISVDNSVAVKLQHVSLKKRPVRSTPSSNLVRCLNWPRSASFLSLHFRGRWGEEQFQWVIQLD